MNATDATPAQLRRRLSRRATWAMLSTQNERWLQWRFILFATRQIEPLSEMVTGIARHHGLEDVARAVVALDRALLEAGLKLQQAED